MVDRDETMSQEAIGEPEPLDEAEAALIAGGQDDDDTENVDVPCAISTCPCFSASVESCVCVGHTHVYPYFG